MAVAQRVIMFIISVSILLIGMLYEYYIDTKATVIGYFWEYDLLFFFESQQIICKRNDSLMVVFKSDC
jgi:hypothetical protein